MKKILPLLMAAGAAAVVVTTEAAPRPLRLVDSHTHMMIENLTPDEEIALLKKAGIDRVVLMASESATITALAKKYPGFVIPSLSFTRPGVKSVRLDDTAGPLVSALYANHDLCGVGEMNGGSMDNAALRALYSAAASTGAPVVVHTDLADPQNIVQVEAAVTAYPKMKFVLAHLGWTAGPELIGRLLDTHSNLYTDLSIRLDPPGPVASRNNGVDLSVLTADDTFQPAWRDLILRHPDRFLFAMDINSFGVRYKMTEELVATARKALAPLPPPVQEAIAHGNTERLWRGCNR